MKCLQKRNCRGNENSWLIFNNFVFGNRAVYEIMWKSELGPDRPQMAKWRMCIAEQYHKTLILLKLKFWKIFEICCSGGRVAADAVVLLCDVMQCGETSSW